MSIIEKLTATITAWADGQPPSHASDRVLAGTLRALSYGYGLGAALRGLTFDIGLSRSHSVSCPVISVGNLSTGGTGKTPLVCFLARTLQASGLRVAILSRGYRRKVSASRVLVVSDGRMIHADVTQAGDEPLMMARSLPGVSVVVGAKRAHAARLAVEKCQAQVILLDDGFQHRALRRDCDLVLWDTLRPAASMALLPRGLMREGLSALRRADALVFTRCNLGHSTRRILGRLKRIAPQLVVFHADLQIASLQKISGDADWPEKMDESSIAGKKIAAFCALGNPQSFWKLLTQQGADIRNSIAFPDHYRPSIEELTLFEQESHRQSAELIVLTEKDQQNLPENWKPKLPAYVVSVEVSFGEDQSRFEQFVLQYCR